MEAGNRKILVYRPAQAWLLVSVCTLLALSGVYLVFELGKKRGSAELGLLEHHRSALERQAKAQLGELLALREQLVVLQRSSEIDRRASLELRDDYARLQGELLALRKELGLYRGILAPGDVEPGLRLQSFELRPGPLDGAFHYDLTLTQVKRNQRYVSGVVEIEVAGVEDGEVRLLRLAQLADGNGKPVKFRFRYFQRLEGKLRLPDGFQPHSVTVRLSLRGKGKPRVIEETSAWPA